MTPRHRERPRRRWPLVAVALAAAAAVGVAAPGTTSGWTAAITDPADTARTAPYFHCPDALTVDAGSALFQYPLTEDAGSTTARDVSGHGNDGTYQGSMTTSTETPIACPRDGGSAYVLDGSTSYVSMPTKTAPPATYSEEVWFRTATAAGRLIGFGTARTGTSGLEDRAVYVNTDGGVTFATYSSRNQIVTSAAGVDYADGAWHQVVATQSPSTGMALYLDGTLVASNSAYTGAEDDGGGYWRIGYDSLSGSWVGSGSAWYVNGAMRYAAVYTTVLTAQQVATHYAAGKLVTGN
ncbi:LamG domain-containing protein [Curtobacterium sp. MCBD17_013]|uniref:LamG domain-containing protein n=1 Tax=unclassified Curtobacterium TaxID=257496 RepID=UPI000DAA244A|nr:MULTISPECIES: LamG domain-containing protein [unclassified Curtobacterium]PZE73859.1 LamG domain-containing protein [Curtobacterium sp. MCBD17_019]PZF60494.1 LamG domain-containing protein [Curtobacterium sp. MCBD17_013]